MAAPQGERDAVDGLHRPDGAPQHHAPAHREHLRRGREPRAIASLGGHAIDGVSSRARPPRPPRISAATWHRLVRPPASSTSGGAVVRQTSSTASQRGWNGQPTGTSPGRGGRPGMTASRRPSCRSVRRSTAQTRHGAQQCPRVRVRGRGERLVDRRLLHRVPGVHHRDVVGDRRHDAEVVGDQDESHLPLALDLGEQPQDLRLHRHVERRRRLVGDEHFGIHRQGGRDHHALAHAAGELVRVVADAVRRPRHLDEVEQLDRPPPGLAAADAAPHSQHLGELVAHGVHGVQRGEGVLEHHRHVLAGVRAALLRRQRQQVGAAEADGPAGHPRRRAEQPHHRERADRLAAAGLAHDRQGASGGHGVRQAVDRARSRCRACGTRPRDRRPRAAARRRCRQPFGGLTSASDRARRGARRRARRVRARWRSDTRAGTAAGAGSHR